MRELGLKAFSDRNSVVFYIEQRHAQWKGELREVASAKCVNIHKYPCDCRVFNGVYTPTSEDIVVFKHTTVSAVLVFETESDDTKIIKKIKKTLWFEYIETDFNGPDILYAFET